MKIFVTDFIIVLCYVDPIIWAQAWLTPKVVARSSNKNPMMTSIHTPSDAERHLDEMQQLWKDLQQREKEVEESNEKMAAMELTQEILETAIEFVQTRERVEKERALHAHEILQDSLNEERALRSAYADVHQDAVDADDTLESYYTKHLGEPFDEKRELAISEVSHQVESYVESRLTQVQDRETKFAMDEIDALKAYDDLKHMEDNLKTTLEAIRATNLGQQATNVP